MTVTLYIVASSTGAPDSGARVIGAYTDRSVADAVRQVAWGFDATVTAIKVDAIDPELRKAMEALGIDHAQNKAPSDFPNDVLDALRASDQWLRTIVDKIDIDPDKTEFAVDAVSSTSRRPLARMTLTERLAANKNVLDTADNAAKRLPTLEEAAHAAAILLRCNGHDLDVWTGGIWPDDADLSLKALIQKLQEDGHD